MVLLRGEGESERENEAGAGGFILCAEGGERRRGRVDTRTPHLRQTAPVSAPAAGRPGTRAAFLNICWPPPPPTTPGPVRRLPPCGGTIPS